MSKKIRFFYPWATLGGVERVLINRARVLANSKNVQEICVHFLSDGGGLDDFKRALSIYGLNTKVELGLDIQTSYDVDFIIDCPEVINIFEKKEWQYYIECHTAYSNNQKYLSNIGNKCLGIIVPSQKFGDVLKSRFSFRDSFIHTFDNFVPQDQAEFKDNICNLPGWNKIPLCYLGRMDSLKNPQCYLDILSQLNAIYPGRFIGLMFGPQSHEINVKAEISKRGLNSLVGLFPSLPFYSVTHLFRSLVNLKGVFISSSKAESFGLSAAEALSVGLPVMLSNIDAHRSLTAPYTDNFIFEDVNNAVKKILDVSSNYDFYSTCCLEIKEKFNETGFLDNFHRLID